MNGSDQNPPAPAPGVEPPEWDARALRERFAVAFAAPGRAPAGPLRSSAEGDGDGPPMSPAARERAIRALEFRRAMALLTRRAVVTGALVAINVAVYAVMAYFGAGAADVPIGRLQRWGADYGPLVTAGQWWRLLSAAFLHIGFLHLAVNMLILAMAGPFVERLVGSAGFLIAYLIAALTGNLASVYWHPMVTGAGASGAIFGVYGVMIGFLALRRDSIPRSALVSVLSSALVFVAYNVAAGYVSGSRTDNAAHLGGLAGGLLCGLLLSQRIDLATGRARRRRRNLLTLAVGSAVVGVALWRLPPSVDLYVEWNRMSGLMLEATRARARLAEQPQAWATYLETRVLPPWRAQHQRLARVDARRLPKEDAQGLAALIDYYARQEGEWGRMIQSIREGAGVSTEALLPLQNAPPD